MSFFFLVFAWLLSSGAHASTSDELATFEGDCGQCHNDFKHPIKIQSSGKCSTCHEAPSLHEGVKQGAKKAAPTEAQLQAGMQYKMYYPQSESRLGSKPNPLKRVPAGEFIMGTDGRLPDEGPQHTRHLSEYYIDQYEVTNLQYKAFIDETGRRSPKHFRNRTFPEGKSDHPVTYVSWKDGNAYCKWAGKRLPTDAEWEKAARSTDGRFFPWGNEFDIDKANTPQRWARLGVPGDTSPVGAFKAGQSVYGVFDMSGNVWEWTDSWYQPYPGNTHMTENYGTQYKTLKGGSWWDCSFYQCGISAPVYNRSFFLRSTKNSSFGFRCAADAAILVQ